MRFLTRPWDIFFEEKIRKIFSEKHTIIDIGGGLRVLKDRGNRYDPKREWILPMIKKVDYKILDPVPDFKPDIIGDIHKLPFEAESQEAILCIAVLEHVENPILAASEMCRVLKKGGFCFLYVPFLYYFHASDGYYGDYWRFTHQTLQTLFKGCATVEISPVRGAIETWLKLSPLGKFNWVLHAGFLLDIATGKIRSRQVSGYNVFLIK